MTRMKAITSMRVALVLLGALSVLICIQAIRVYRHHAPHQAHSIEQKNTLVKCFSDASHNTLSSNAFAAIREYCLESVAASVAFEKTLADLCLFTFLFAATIVAFAGYFLWTLHSVKGQ